MCRRTLDTRVEIGNVIIPMKSPSQKAAIGNAGSPEVGSPDLHGN